MRNEANSKGPNSGADQHLDDGRCLDLAAGLLDAEQTRVALAHLERCQACEETIRSLYGDYFFAESRLAAGAGSSATKAATADQAADVRPPALSVVRPHRRRMASLLTAAAAVAAVFVVLVWPEFTNDDSTGYSITVIREHLGESSAQGLIFPGTNVSKRAQESDRRSGLDLGNPGFEEVLADLEARRRKEGLTPDEAYWLAAGHISRGNLSRARSLLPPRTSNAAAEIRWVSLRAQIAYRESNLLAARDLLQAVRNQDAGNPIHSFNLGLVFLELGEMDLARENLLAAQAMSGSTALAERAEALLKSVSRS